MIETLAEDLRPEKYNSLNEVIEHMLDEHASLPAFSCFGRTLTYGEVDELSSCFANYLQAETNLEVGDRIAIQLPNLLQFPVVFYGAIKAGLVAVNTNPLYTAKEMEYQFKDSGVKAIVILESFCDKLEQIIDQTEIETVVFTKFGDLQIGLQKHLLNLGAKYIGKMIPKYNLPKAVPFMQTVSGSNEYLTPSHSGKGNDVALILYTGGTTGVAKGAMLSLSLIHI